MFYHFRADLPEFADVERADHAQLRFRLSAGASRYCFPDGHEQDAPPVHIVGPTTGSVRSSAIGPVDAFGMGVTPLGWAGMFGISAAACANRVLDAHEVLGPGVSTFADRLAAADTIDAKVVIAEEMIAVFVAADMRSSVFSTVVDAWLAGSASPDVHQLEAHTGLSARQLERRCNALYGAPPKLLARKYRALRAAVAYATHQESLDDLLEHGFYDQSHLIRELKQFTGMTPTQLHDAPTALSQLTISQRTALHGQVPPIISDT
nr:helix-turn-helix domain-containing protein [Sphingomonas japonica]